MNKLIIIFNASFLLGLAGCAYSPGFNTGQPNASRSLFSSLASPATKPGVTTEQAAEAENSALIPITAGLINQQRTHRASGVPPEVNQFIGEPVPYLIGPSDILNIVVWNHPDLQLAQAGTAVIDSSGAGAGVGNGFNVSPDGLVQFPYVGPLKLGGLTEYQARDLLTSSLSRYLINPQVTLRIQSYRSGRIYIDGEVRSPGLQTLNDIGMTLPEAIGRAGGLTPLADRAHVAITRNKTTTRINLPVLTSNGINPASLVLRNGDMLRVMSREEAKVFVLGEVLRPSTQYLRNGSLTLNEALGESGGINPASADPRQIYVVRSANFEKPEVYHLDARSPMAYALSEGFELQARDVVYVDPVPLVRWNRVISLILPSAQAVTVSRSVTGN
jgi:polysaccharide export outer membrane protein